MGTGSSSGRGYHSAGRQAAAVVVVQAGGQQWQF